MNVLRELALQFDLSKCLEYRVSLFVERSHELKVAANFVWHSSQAIYVIVEKGSARFRIF